MTAKLFRSGCETVDRSGRGAVQAPDYHWASRIAQSRRPTVGALMELCEENYRALLRLVPDLEHTQGDLRSLRAGGLDLQLEIIEQAPYTTLLRLTYFFPYEDGQIHRIREADPDALLRAYHDAEQVEVLDLRQTILPVHSHYRYPALEAKWRANLFLSKWLAYCLNQGHGFGSEAGADSGAEDFHSTRVYLDGFI